MENRSLQSQSIPNFSTLCYCESTLTKYENPGNGTICRDCIQSIPSDDQYLYLCLNENCMYKALSSATYLVCSECYRSLNVQSSKNHLMLAKFSHSLDRISLVVPYFFFPSLCHPSI